MKIKDVLTAAILLGAVLYLLMAISAVRVAEAEEEMQSIQVPARRLEGENKKKPKGEATKMAVKDEGGFKSTRAEDVYRYLFSEEDEMILRQISMAEAGGEDVIGKALVIRVVINRIESEDFPDTVKEVVMQEGQFSSVGDGESRYYTVEADNGTLEALLMCERGWNESRDALYFESCKGDCWQTKTCEYLFTYGGHSFYK